MCMEQEYRLNNSGDYHWLYKYLVIMTDRQIERLRNIALGMQDLSAFPAEEIEELEKKINGRFLEPGM